MVINVRAQSWDAAEYQEVRIARARQIAALPLRRTPVGGLEVLLVTSRETQRWIIPKGWPWPDHSDPEAAAGEALEEAGLLGRIETTRFGTYVYGKRQTDETVEVGVDVFLLWVSEELPDWKEREERERTWFAVETAAITVDEPQLRALLRALRELPRSRG